MLISNNYNLFSLLKKQLHATEYLNNKHFIAYRLMSTSLSMLNQGLRLSEISKRMNQSTTIKDA